MNEVIKNIKTRRSVRSYDPKPIPRDVANAIIDAANEAPSAMNSQPWRFVVVHPKGESARPTKKEPKVMWITNGNVIRAHKNPL